MKVARFVLRRGEWSNPFSLFDVVTAPTKTIAEEVRNLISEFLAKRGLTLSETKTKIAHIDEGFDFLGYNIRKYRGVLLMKPSKESVKKITRKISEIIHKATSWTQGQLIQILNPIIIGWSNYHRHIASKDTFNKMDSIMWEQLWRWAKRRHPDKGHKWIANRYWSSIGTRNWVFCTEKLKIRRFFEIPIRRHILVKFEMNPYLNREYFLTRLEKMNRKTPDVQTKLTYFSTGRPKFGL